MKGLKTDMDYSGDCLNDTVDMKDLKPSAG